MRIKYIYVFFVCFLFNHVQCNAQTDIVTPKKKQIFQVGETMIISWNKLSYASQYYVQVSTNNNFTELIINTTTTQTSFSTILSHAGNLFVRVRSYNDINWSESIDISVIDFNSVIGLKAWFSADSMINTIDNNVNSWTNIKDNSIVASQAAVNRRPYLENVCRLNNRPVLTFTGNNYLDLNIPINSTNFSIYMIRNLRAGDPIVQYVLGSSPNAGFFAETAVASQGPGVFFPNLGINFFSNETVRDTNYYMYVNTQSSIFRNNQRIANSNSIITNPNIVRIGGRIDAPYNLTGSIAEFMYFDRILDSTNNEIVNKYFCRKFGPPVNLGPDTILGNSFCDSVTITVPNCYNSYTWSNGKKTQSIKVLPNNSYSVTVRDILGNTSTDEISVFPYKRLGNKTIAVCKGEIITIDLKTPPSFSVLWNDNTTDKIKTINSTGQYTVKVTDAIGCFVFDTINVIVDEPTLLPVPDAGNNLTLCEGEKLFLISPTAFDSILWSNGSTGNFIAVTNPGNYNVYGITSSGCVINQPINITIAGKAPTALFAVPPACQDAPLTFTDTSKVPAGNTIQNWSWTFSNNSTSTIQNPTTLFSSLGTQTVTLKITTNVGCTDSIAKTFTVNRKPVPSFFNLLSCAGNATTFVDQTVANSASLIDWRWDFAGLGVSTGIQNPAFRFPDATNYTVKLVATNSNFCSDSITLPVAVNPSPVADFSFDSVCGRSPISYKFLATVTSPSTITAWNWDFGDGEGETAIRNPQHAYDEPGIYEVSLAVRSSNQCTDTIMRSVRVFDFPTVDFEVSSAQCVGKEIQFTDISTTPDGSDITKWTWYFAGLATSSQQNPRYQFNAEGNYTVQLTATNEVGCSGTKQRSVAVSSLPQPKFTFTPANGLPPLNVSFTNQSPVSGSYVWDYGDGTAPVAAYNPPAHIYTVKGSYPIKLIGTDFRGCVDTLTRYILVDKAYLDGVIAAVILIPNGNFYKVQVTLQNNSNIEITSAGLGLQLGGGAILRETWNGSLLPGRSATFLFTGEVSAGEAQVPVICATIENLNSYAPEDRTDNNTTCKELSVGDFEVFSIYPNPALENINLGVMLPQDGTVSIRLIDYLGQQLNMITFSGIKGYNNFTINTAALGASVYIAEVAYKDQIIRKKFVRGNSK